jgi:ribosome-interacting GTPase 1
MVRCVREFFDEGCEAVTVDMIFEEMQKEFGDAELFLEGFIDLARGQMMELLPSVKKRVEELMHTALIPITPHALENYITYDDQKIPILELPVTLNEARKCVAGGQVNGTPCKTAGFILAGKNILTKLYYEHQEQVMDGVVVKQKKRMKSLDKRLGGKTETQKFLGHSED